MAATPIYAGASSAEIEINATRTSDGAAVRERVPCVALVGGDGQASGFSTYPLAVNAAITSGGFTTPVTGIAGASYILAIQAAAFNSATIKLQTLGPDGATWIDVTSASVTANGAVGVVVGNNATLRLAATGGAPTGVYATLS